MRDHLATDAVSIGPFVISGGELAAMVVADAVIRKLPGALGDAQSAVEESYSEALGGAPEYPHYTRPPSYRGWDVPEVLRSGDHERVREWRLERSRSAPAARSAPGRSVERRQPSATIRVRAGCEVCPRFDRLRPFRGAPPFPHGKPP